MSELVGINMDDVDFSINGFLVTRKGGNQTILYFSDEVEQVLKDQITDEQQLEQIMDGLCDFCDEIRFIDLYRSLCRHIYYQYPQLVGEHVALFRALFEGPDEK